MDLLMNIAPTATEAGLLLGALVFLNKKIDGVKSDIYEQLNNGIKDELSGIKSDISEIQGYLKGKREG